MSGRFLVSESPNTPIILSFDGTTPVWKEDIQLKKKVSFVFLVAELGKGAINFVTNNGKTTLITYQEGI